MNSDQQKSPLANLSEEDLQRLVDLCQQEQAAKAMSNRAQDELMDFFRCMNIDSSVDLDRYAELSDTACRLFELWEIACTRFWEALKSAARTLLPDDAGFVAIIAMASAICDKVNDAMLPDEPAADPKEGEDS